MTRTLTAEPVWIAGKWRDAFSASSFTAESPATGRALEGEYPVSSPFFTAVGIPRSMLRFATLHCYDNVRPDGCPRSLRHNPILTSA